MRRPFSRFPATFAAVLILILSNRVLDIPLTTFFRGARYVFSGALPLAFLSLFLWASAFPAIRVALRGYSPTHLALARYLVASATLGVLMLRDGFVRRDGFVWPARADWWKIAGAGLSGFSIYNVALNAGETHVSAGIASFLVNTGPLWALILVTFFGHERVSRRGWMGVLLSLAGVAVLAFSRDKGQVLDHDFLRSAALVLLAAFCAGVYTLLQKQLLQKYSALRLTTWVIWAGTAWLLVFSRGLITTVRDAPFSATAAMVYMGILPGALAYALWSHVAAQMSVSRAVSFFPLMPVMATAIAWLWLGERLPPLALLGGVLALGGIILVNTARAPTSNCTNDAH